MNQINPIIVDMCHSILDNPSIPIHCINKDLHKTNGYHNTLKLQPILRKLLPPSTWSNTTD